MGQYLNPLRVKKKILYSSQTRSLNLNPIPLGARRDEYPKKPAPLPSLVIFPLAKKTPSSLSFPILKSTQKPDHLIIALILLLTLLLV